ncbi:hypothetical protein [Sorangium sp. So ce145]|uniref:hypothetical protein n=1 Tax=Sorangium sp. So ce145 TaxID=3133285 RepID=UPI003F63121C
MTTAAYDTLGRMVTLTSPDMGRTEWRYDRSGNVGARQTAKLLAEGANKLIRYEYDYNRLRRVNYPDSTDVTYVYGAPDEAGDEHGNRAGRLVEGKRPTNAIVIVGVAPVTYPHREGGSDGDEGGVGRAGGAMGAQRAERREVRAA